MTTSKKATVSELPLLSTPTGGTMSQPESPQQWHAHPYVWAWHAGLGALSREYIERECQTAADAGAPPDAVYKTRGDDPTMPGKWITVGMIASTDQQKQVREYAEALVAWADALKGRREQNKVQPLHQVLVVLGHVRSMVACPADWLCR
ncbi:hypothetical protein [Streptomyces sp. NPDC059080]|uniref:hypothetical protein n=1 Tax=Streptomyces sp. NPDC059080 TaxID=3346718 RepID=UPI00369F988E